MSNDSEEKTNFRVATTLLLTISPFYGWIIFFFYISKFNSKYGHYLLEYCPVGGNLQGKTTVSWMHLT